MQSSPVRVHMVQYQGGVIIKNKYEKYDFIMPIRLGHSDTDIRYKKNKKNLGSFQPSHKGI